MKKTYIAPSNHIHDLSVCNIIAESPISGGGDGNGLTPEARRNSYDDEEEGESSSWYSGSMNKSVMDGELWSTTWQ